MQLRFDMQQNFIDSLEMALQEEKTQRGADQESHWDEVNSSATNKYNKKMIGFYYNVLHSLCFCAVTFVFFSCCFFEFSRRLVYDLLTILNDFLVVQYLHVFDLSFFHH